MSSQDRASCYSYHRLGENENPGKLVELMWCILLIILSIALVFSKSSMNNLQSVSIIAAFPIGMVILLHKVIFGQFLIRKKFLQHIKVKRRKHHE